MRLARVPVHEIEQLVIHGAGAVAAIADRHGGAVFQVIAHQQTADAAQRFLYRGDLHQNVGAVALVLHHRFEAAHLAGDAAQPADGGGFQLGVDGDGQLFIAIACTLRGCCCGFLVCFMLPSSASGAGCSTTHLRN